MGLNSSDSKLGFPDRTDAASAGLGKIPGNIESPQTGRDTAIPSSGSPVNEDISAVLSPNRPKTVPHTTEIVGLFSGGAAFSNPAGISVDGEGRALLWPGTVGAPRELLNPGFQTRAAAVYRGGALIALAGGLEIRIYAAGSSAPLFVTHDIRARAGALRFEPNGESLMIGATTGEVFRWRFKLGKDSSPTAQEKALERYQRRASVVSALSFHPSGRFFISGDWDGGLNAELLYDQDLYGGDYDKNLFGSRFFQGLSTSQDRIAGGDRINDISAAADGSFLAVGLDDGGLETWSMRGFSRRLKIEGAHRGAIFAVDTSPSSAEFLSVGRDGFLRVWSQMESLEGEWRASKLFERQVPGARRAAFLNDNLILVGTLDGGVQRLTLGE